MTRHDSPLSTTELDRIEKLLVSDVFHEQATSDLLPAAEQAGDTVPGLDEECQMKREASATFGDSVMAAYSYWLDKRISHAPVRRGGPKVGRNGPCPCGSGKKYKSCHGSSDMN